MVYLLRHLFAVLILPTTVLVVVPIWIARNAGVAFGWPETWSGVAAMLAGTIVLLIGLLLFVRSLHHFFVEGRGTLAPWDPPRRLVVRGPYRYVRNPMISGVMLALVGTALVLRSWPHATWAAAFAVLNIVTIPLVEEPMLVDRFGNDYRHYCRHVPRFIPRLRPWQQEDDAGLR